MKKITIRSLLPADLNAIGGVQSAYASVYPDAPIIPGDVYLSPAYEDGQNLYCAIDDRGDLVGYAPLYPVLIRDTSSLPHTLWTEIKVHPQIETPHEIKDRMFEQILIRARQLTQEFPGHPIHLTFQYFPSETASIEYVLSKGCRYTDSVFTMRRDLSLKIPDPASFDDIVIRPWKMESEAEQRMYVQVRNRCFPEAPVALGEWQYFMSSPMWSVGTTFAAFHNEQLVGNAAVFWSDEENRLTGRKIGYTEYIFVHPDWRGKNIARELITLGLEFLQERGLEEAHLEVRANNQNALRLYQGLGFEVTRESRFYVLSL